MRDDAARVVVPDLVGLAVDTAISTGHDADVVVVGAVVDGPPLGVLTWPGSWVVTGQVPVAGVEVPRWADVQVTFRRADDGQAGDRAPRLPSPSPDDLATQAERDD